MTDIFGKLKAFLLSIYYQIQAQVAKVLKDPKQIMVATYAILVILIAAFLAILIVLAMMVYQKIVKPLRVKLGL